MVQNVRLAGYCLTHEHLTHRGTLALLGAAAVAFATFAPLVQQPAPNETAAPIVRMLADAPPAPTPTPTVAPEPAPAPVEPAPAPAPDPVYGQYPSGWSVPFIPSSDPNNAAGGDYDVSACASGTASTVGGQVVCD